MLIFLAQLISVILVFQLFYLFVHVCDIQVDTEIKSDEDSKVVPLDIIKWCLGLKV